jgi:hypothetical protein
MLGIAVLVVVLAFALEVRPDQRVAFRGFSAYPVPETCFSWAWFGIKCPGCGLTRSFIYLAQGDWSASVRMHRLGWVMALAVLLQFPYRLLSLARGNRAVLPAFLRRLVAALLIVLLLGSWLLGLLGV